MTAQQLYRDDGPLAALIGRAGHRLPAGETALAGVGAAVLAVAAALALAGVLALVLRMLT